MLASVATVEWSGPESIVTSGATPTGGGSIHQLYCAGVRSTLPERSTARTSKTWLPKARVYSAGEVHGSKEPPSIAHWNSTVLALSAPVKRKRSTPPVLGLVGASLIWVVGAIGSDCGAGPPSQRMLKHWRGSRVSGSSGPRLPMALLPPPSMLNLPLLPLLAQMPQPPLSLAMLALIVWLTL